MKISLMLLKKYLDAKPGPLFQWPYKYFRRSVSGKVKYHENDEQFLYHEKYRREVVAKPGPRFQWAKVDAWPTLTPHLSSFHWIAWVLRRFFILRSAKFFVCLSPALKRLLPCSANQSHRTYLDKSPLGSTVSTAACYSSREVSF